MNPASCHCGDVCSWQQWQQMVFARGRSRSAKCKDVAQPCASHVTELARTAAPVDKLGVTGSSPVPPIGKGPGNGAFFVTGDGVKGPSSHQNRLGVSTVSADRAEAGSEEHLAGFITVLFPEADLDSSR